MAEPWFRMHANPTKLKVTARLMEYAKIDKMRAVGHLATFWGAVSQHCPGGTIVGIPDSLIEEWADWKSKKGVFASFVRLLHSADGKINDYEEYSGVLDVTREKNRKRKQEQRDKERQSRGRHADVTEDSLAPKGVTSEATIRNDTKRYKRTTKATTSSPEGLDKKDDPEITSPDQPAVPADWVAQFGSDWLEIVKGVPDYGRIGKTAKAAVEKFGFDRARVAWRRFVADPKARQYRFASFAQDFGDYEPQLWGVNGEFTPEQLRELGIIQ